MREMIREAKSHHGASVGAGTWLDYGKQTIGNFNVRILQRLPMAKRKPTINCQRLLQSAIRRDIVGEITKKRERRKPICSCRF